MRLSDETKKKIRAARARQIITKEHAVRISFAKKGGVPECGTVRKYKGARRRDPCRCNRCRAAYRAYKRERRRAAKAL